MTPTEVNTAARRRYNAVSDSFFSDAEILDIIYQKCLEFARRTLCIEDKDTSLATVNGTRVYSLPSYTLGLKRVEINGRKIHKIDDREDDVLTLNNSATTATGSPLYYFVFDDTLYLRPVPSEAQTITLYRFKEPAAVTAASTLEIPTQWHMALVDGIVSELAAKDKNFDVSNYFQGKWDKTLDQADRFYQKIRRRDAFAYVKNEEMLTETIIGAV